jgi:hypothetical protein
MRNNPLITGLLVVDCILAFLILILAVGYEYHFRQLRALGGQIYQDQLYQTRVTALVQDAVEYGKTHPAIEPVLNLIGARPAPSAAPANAKPAK